MLSALLAALATLLIVAAQAQAAGSVGFAAPSAFGVGTYPNSVATGDLNGDTKPDVVAGNFISGDVTVLLGNGSGGFSAAPDSPFSVGSSPTSVAIGDVNGDTKADLVSANGGGDNVTVLLGDGSGGFTAAAGSPFGVGSFPYSVAIADVNGDTKPDLATTNAFSNNATVLLGDGSGGFAAAAGSPFGVGSVPTSVAIADLNGDTKLDLVSGNENSNNVTALLGNGSGGFAAAPGSPFGVGTTPSSVAIADLNGDTKPDLATANYNSANVTVLLGNGSGGFGAAPGSPFGVGVSDPISVTIGDLNGDTKLDLVSAMPASNNVTVLLGNGSGGFAAALGSPFGTGTDPRAVAIDDFNGDTKPDLVSSNVESNDVTVLLNTTSWITGKRIRLTDNADPAKKKLSILSKDTRIGMGNGNGSADDPTMVGLTVRVESASAGFDNTYTLPAGGWALLGQPGQNKGYKYKDSQLAFGPIYSALLKPGSAPGKAGQITVSGKGAGLGHSAAINANPVNVEVIAGDEHYCMRFGGTTKFRLNNYYQAINAPMSPGCPA